jgi:diguanylate cyclase (GGDEF)-like protein
MEGIPNTASKRKSGVARRVTKSIGIAVQTAIVGFRQAYSQGDTLDSIMGYVDTLTNIPNRRAYERDKSDYREGYALVLIDIDNFKLINDTKGHGFGDIILKRLATIITDAVGADGKAYRIGGDEFVAIVRLFYLEGFCARIKMCMRKEDSFTISQGVTPLIAHDTSDAAMEIVDSALYYVKNNGKNGVCCFDVPQVTQFPIAGTPRSPYYPFKLSLHQNETDGERDPHGHGRVAFFRGVECPLSKSFFGGLLGAEAKVVKDTDVLNCAVDVDK